MSDQSKWPAHLRDDAPHVVCSMCGREAWGEGTRVGWSCRMTQPDGSTCPGTFENDERDLQWVRRLLAAFRPEVLEQIAAATHYPDYGTYMAGLARLALYYRAELAAAVDVAEHLAQMIGRETWRAHGADDGQGHYEGDHHAELVQADIERWKEIVS